MCTQKRELFMQLFAILFVAFSAKNSALGGRLCFCAGGQSALPFNSVE